MKYIICALLCIIVCNLAYAQDNYNIVCKDFTFQNKKCETCGNLKQVFESTISKPSYPFKIIEREKMAKILETIQEEKNLYKDFSNVFSKKLQLAGIDFLVIGDLDQSIGDGSYSLFISFIKITGKNVTEKLPLLINISKNQFFNNDELKKIINTAIESFVKSYFILKSENNNLVTTPELFKALNKRDSAISRVQNDLVNVKKYSDMAKLGITGFEGEPGYGILYQSPLNDLMKNVYFVENKTYHTKFTDDALSYTNQVIEKFPNFPFGYFSKAEILLSRNKHDIQGLECANKAINIFEITTTIAGHNPQHDQALDYLKTLIKQ